MEKYNCAALLELTADGGCRQFGSAGYLLEGQIALLVERGGRQVFMHKSKVVPAEGTVLENYRRFVAELSAVLSRS